MTKKDDKIEHMDEYIRNKEADERAWKRLIGYVKLGCLISLNVGLAGAYIIREFGSFLYNYCKPLKDWVDAIILASKGQ